jgi:hypothetical protein
LTDPQVTVYVAGSDQSRIYELSQIAAYAFPGFISFAAKIIDTTTVSTNKLPQTNLREKRPRSFGETCRGIA